MEKTKLALFAIFIATLSFCQNSASLNWHHKSFSIDSIPGISTDQVYNELQNGRKSNKIIVAILDLLCK